MRCEFCMKKTNFVLIMKIDEFASAYICEECMEDPDIFDPDIDEIIGEKEE